MLEVVTGPLPTVVLVHDGFVDGYFPRRTVISVSIGQSSPHLSRAMCPRPASPKR